MKWITKQARRSVSDSISFIIIKQPSQSCHSGVPQLCQLLSLHKRGKCLLGLPLSDPSSLTNLIITLHSQSLKTTLLCYTVILIWKKKTFLSKSMISTGLPEPESSGVIFSCNVLKLDWVVKAWEELAGMYTAAPHPNLLCYKHKKVCKL